MVWWWSWLLSLVGITGLWLAGSGKKLGWGIGIASQVLWLAYSITTDQCGFLASVFMYTTVHTRNWMRWNRADRMSRQLAAACGIGDAEDECYDS